MIRTSFVEGDIRQLRVGRRLWVGPAGAEPPAEDLARPGDRLLPIWLAPGPAFGAGSHPTTQLCLRSLERHLRPGVTLLDLGTGSGILAIAGARLVAAPAAAAAADAAVDAGAPASTVLALDTDADAVAVARGNVRLNGVAGIVRVEQGTLADALACRWGVGQESWVVANILAHVIVAFLEGGLAEIAAGGGGLILSGILRGQTPAIYAALTRAGLELLAREQQEEWVCLIARRPR